MEQCCYQEYSLLSDLHLATLISRPEPNVYFYRYVIVTSDSSEVGNGIMSYSAHLKLQLGHVDKLELSMPTKTIMWV
jgi:hypothetical protein